jgi:hypothetical protein
LRSSTLSDAEIGSSAGGTLAAAVAACRVSVETTALARLSITNAIAQAPPPRQMNGSIGMPGRNDITIMTVPDMPSAVG